VRELKARFLCRASKVAPWAFFVLVWIIGVTTGYAFAKLEMADMMQRLLINQTVQEAPHVEIPR